MSHVEDFQGLRPLLFSIAYRMLGSATEAEDVLQDAWLRYSDVSTLEIRSPKAYLTTIVTRLALDRLKSARTAREQYVGPWLPEPVLTEGQPEPVYGFTIARNEIAGIRVVRNPDKLVYIARQLDERTNQRRIS